VIGGLEKKERDRLGALAICALRAAEQGRVHLVQERLGPDRFAYIAIARPKPTAAEASLSDRETTGIVGVKARSDMKTRAGNTADIHTHIRPVTLPPVWSTSN
jgi:hypothetical protein